MKIDMGDIEINIKFDGFNIKTLIKGSTGGTGMIYAPVILIQEFARCFEEDVCDPEMREEYLEAIIEMLTIMRETGTNEVLDMSIVNNHTLEVR